MKKFVLDIHSKKVHRKFEANRPDSLLTIYSGKGWQLFVYSRFFYLLSIAFEITRGLVIQQFRRRFIFKKCFRKFSRVPEKLRRDSRWFRAYPTPPSSHPTARQDNLYTLIFYFFFLSLLLLFFTLSFLFTFFSLFFFLFILFFYYYLFFFLFFSFL